ALTSTPNVEPGPNLPATQGQTGGPATRAIQKKPSGLPLDDPAALQRGEQDLLRMLDAAGGLVRFRDPEKEPVHLLSRLPGLSYQTLEIGRVESKNGGNWSIQFVIPHLLHVNGAGHGFLYSEYVDDSSGEGYKRAFRREVYTGQLSWAELGSFYLRDKDSERRSRQHVLSELFLGYMPHSLTMLGAKLAFRDETEINGQRIARYAVELPRSVALHSGEEVRWVDLFVDQDTWEPLRLSYVPLGPLARVIDIEFSGTLEMLSEAPLRDQLAQSLSAELRRNLEQQGADEATLAAAAVGADDLVLPESVRIPFRRYMADSRAREVFSWETAEWRLEDLPVEALHRPWQTGAVWTPPRHADHWDPPGEDR
ncbi:MAG: hypothetical protein ACYS26_21465, partial [Planctomycetota bacterium]